MEEGFRPTHIEGAGQGVHWGCARIARQFAEKRALWSDDPPAILAARLSDVLRSGAAVPDVAWDNQAADWRQSFDELGAFAVVGGVFVDNMKLLAIPDLPIHPKALDARAERLLQTRKRHSLMVRVPPGLEMPSEPVVAGPDEIVEFDWGTIELEPPALSAGA